MKKMISVLGIDIGKNVCSLVGFDASGAVVLRRRAKRARTPMHAAGVKLQNMIKRTRQHLFVFVTNRELPATNNGSERALRPCAVFRKITNGFRTEWGAKLYADIRSVVETARRRAIGALDAIRLTLAGKPLAPA
jgi:transposase